MVGGASTTAEWAAEIGADGHGETAADAVALAEAFVGARGGARTMLANLELYRRATTGEICAEKDFDLKRFIPAVRRLVKKYGIAYDPATPVPSDDDLADRLWEAGRRLFLDVGVYCVDTERVIRFDEAELDQALAHAPAPRRAGKRAVLPDDPRPPA